MASISTDRTPQSRIAPDNTDGETILSLNGDCIFSPFAYVLITLP